MFVVFGVGYALVAIAVVTLVQRLAADDLLARAFGVTESLYWFTTGLGAAAAPPLLSWLGVRGALAGTGACLLALVAARAGALGREEFLAALSRLPRAAQAAEQFAAARLGKRRGCASSRRPREAELAMTTALVAVNTDVIGKSYPASVYAVGREKVREYARAVGETNPLHLDVEAAREAGHADVVAPPMFAVVYAMPAVAVGMFDPEVGIEFARLVHAGQDFEWGPLVVAGDEITTTVSIKDVGERRGSGFFVFESVSVNGRGETVCTGTWSNIVRAA